ncbi:hypothetical protein H9623_11995 [Oerskovia sp. Sa1BUA8]|uniref:Lipoprotein n=1 Tax=Oerskovia douganii TaxID=2762210 RepID=A0A9D5YZZ4_9CELL|nr:hypothetical protein [Oerskovia douganii]MBE7701021.1 hypothetical protein [Oerskovia douganii]
MMNVDLPGWARVGAATLAVVVLASGCASDSVPVPPGLETCAPRWEPVASGDLPDAGAANPAATLASGSFTEGAHLSTEGAAKLTEGKDYSLSLTITMTEFRGRLAPRVETVGEDCSFVATYGTELEGDALLPEQTDLVHMSGEGAVVFGEVSTGAPGQVSTFTRRGDRLAWLETRSTNLDEFDWRVRATRIGDDAPTLVADYRDFYPGGATPRIIGIDPYLSMSTSRLAWNAASKAGGSSDLLSAGLAGDGDVEVLAENGHRSRR